MTLNVDDNSMQRSWPRRLLNRMEVDRAVFYALLLRGWQLVGGAGTVVLIAMFFSPELQGYYYTFASLMALQTFFELGFNIVITNVSSHEWAKLELDENGSITGDATALSRIVSLGRLIFRWYAAACVLFIVFVGGIGAVFLSQKDAPLIAWQQPWAVLTVFSGLLLWMLPFNALLEGCHQVAVVNRFRVVQAVAASFAVWAGIASGWQLWAPVAAVAARVLCDLYLLGVRYRRFFKPFWSAPSTSTMQWRTEVWPMQWRLAIQGVFGYFAYALFTPVMFHYHGAVVAGQMGMSWAVITAVQAAALAWVQARVPLFGSLIANRDYRELDRVFSRLVAVSLCVIICGGVLLCSAVYGLNEFYPKLASRLLQPQPFTYFVAAVIVYHVPHCQAMYLRAHKRDPLLQLSTISNTAIGLSVWLLGRTAMGPTGAAVGYLAVVVVLTLPATTLLWNGCRKRWHAEENP